MRSKKQPRPGTTRKNPPRSDEGQENGDIEDLVASALSRLKLLARGQELPEPFATHEGESELTTTRFMIVPTSDRPEGSIVAVKTCRSDKSEGQLWTQINSARAQSAHRALLPVPGNKRSDRCMVFHDGHWAESTLRQLGLLGEKESLPPPRRIFSGLAGFSRLYLFHLGGDGSPGHTVLVKFDRPDRQAAEWQAIERLRRQTNLPAELLLPVAGNTVKQGVLVFPAFQGLTVTGEVVQLNELLIRRLLSNYRHVDLAVERLFTFLKRLYVDGRHLDQAASWQAGHPELKGATHSIESILASRGLPLEARDSEWDASGLVGYPLRLANPLHYLSRRLTKDAPGRLFLARVHGDLQSTNVLIALGDLSRPEGLAVIDVEKLAPNQRVVDDLVRIEADFWRSVFTAIAGTAQIGERAPSSHLPALASLAAALDRLDGRASSWAHLPPPMAKLAADAGRFVFDLRHRSWKLLTLPGNGQHWPRDWFHGLLFYYLKAILRPLVHEDPLRLRAVLLAAAMAEQTLRDMEAGRYDKDRRFPRRWTESPASGSGSHHPPTAMGPLAGPTGRSADSSQRRKSGEAARRDGEDGDPSPVPVLPGPGGGVDSSVKVGKVRTGKHSIVTIVGAKGRATVNSNNINSFNRVTDSFNRTVSASGGAIAVGGDVTRSQLSAGKKPGRRG